MSVLIIDTIGINPSSPKGSGMSRFLGERLQACLKILQLSQREAAEKCGWGKPARISHYINNRNFPAIEDIEILSQVLNCTPEWLTWGIGHPPAYLTNDIPKGQIPIVTWEVLKDLSLRKEIKIDYRNLPFLEYCNNNAQRRLFAVKLRPNFQSDQFNKRIYFADSDYLIVNLDLTPSIGDYVLVYSTKFDELSFMHFIGTKMRPYLTLPNSSDNYIIDITDDLIITGTVIGRITLLK